MTHNHPANQAIHDERTSSQRIADAVAARFGSWPFIVAQTIVVAAWIAGNGWLLSRPFDAFPFILLNLAFSTQAAYAAPLILLSQNRQAEHDRLRAEADHKMLSEIRDLLKGADRD